MSSWYVHYPTGTVLYGDAAVDTFFGIADLDSCNYLSAAERAAIRKAEWREANEGDWFSSEQVARQVAENEHLGCEGEE